MIFYSVKFSKKNSVNHSRTLKRKFYASQTLTSDKEELSQSAISLKVIAVFPITTVSLVRPSSLGVRVRNLTNVLLASR